MPRTPDFKGPNGYPCNPRTLNKLAWFYEQPKGVHMVQYAERGGQGSVVIIPWRRLEKAVDNHRKLKSRK